MKSTYYFWSNRGGGNNGIKTNRRLEEIARETSQWLEPALLWLLELTLVHRVAIYCRTGTAFYWPRHMEKCLCQRLGNIQCVCRSSSWIDVPVGIIEPTHQLLVRDAHSAAESVLPSSACAAIYGVMPHVHISNTPTSTNVIVELDGLYCKQASIVLYSSIVYVPFTHYKSFRRRFY